MSINGEYLFVLENNKGINIYSLKINRNPKLIGNIFYDFH